MFLGAGKSVPLQTHNSGYPFTAEIGSCNTSAGSQWRRLLSGLSLRYFGGVIQDPSKNQFINGIFPNPKAEFDVTTKGPGCRCRNIFTGPGYSDVDLSLAKNFVLAKFPLLGEQAEASVPGRRVQCLQHLESVELRSCHNSDRHINTGQFGRANTAFAGRSINSRCGSISSILPTGDGFGCRPDSSMIKLSAPSLALACCTSLSRNLRRRGNLHRRMRSYASISPRPAHLFRTSGSRCLAPDAPI